MRVVHPVANVLYGSLPVFSERAEWHGLLPVELRVHLRQHVRDGAHFHLAGSGAGDLEGSIGRKL